MLISFLTFFRRSSRSLTHAASSPWPTLVRIRTSLNSSSRTPSKPISTASTLSLESAYLCSSLVLLFRFGFGVLLPHSGPTSLLLFFSCPRCIIPLCSMKSIIAIVPYRLTKPRGCATPAFTSILTSQIAASQSIASFYN